MDKVEGRSPYRCLPLVIANTSGWEILCPANVTLEYNGGKNNEDIKISTDDPNFAVHDFAQAHFRHGVLTFHVGYMFRTPPGWAMWAMGPPNEPKHGITALAGLVETDWLPFPFTMNWKFTRPCRVRFEKGEPFCFVSLVEHGRLDEVEPVVRDLHEDPELLERYESWRTSRGDFIAKLKERDPDAMQQSWQRFYLVGKGPDGEAAPEGHVFKRRLKPLKPKDS